MDRLAFVPLPFDDLQTARIAGVTGTALDSFVRNRPSPQFFDPEIYGRDDDTTAETQDAVNAYVTDVHDWMATIRTSGSCHLLGPRAAIVGATLLRRGYKRDWVEKVTAWKGLEVAQIAKISPIAAERIGELNDAINWAD